MDTPTQNILLIITFGERSWVVLTNGTWQPIITDYMVPDGVIQYTVQLQDISTQGGNIYVYVDSSWIKIPTSVLQSVKQQNEQHNNDTEESIRPLDPIQQGDSYFFQTVERTGDELIAESGFDSTPTQASSIKNHQSSQNSDDFADISVDVIKSCSPNGEIYDITGNVDDVEDGNTVYVTVTDTEGNDITFLTLVVGGNWTVLDADLSGLVDGQLTVIANTADNSGNLATDDSTFTKDTLAQITISVETGIDEIINSSEASTVKISGTVVGVEDNQAVTVNVSDGTDTLTFTTSVITGVWSIDSVDLSSLSDGELSYSATVTDLNCNTAETKIALGKDTQAGVTIAVNTNTDTTDDVINKIESTQVDISGTVSNIEDNQTVTLTVTDGLNTLAFSAIVTEGTWQINNADLSTLNDGTLTYLAKVNDIAGNIVDTSIIFVKDTQATITITVDTNSDLSTNSIDNVINAVESTSVDISGVVGNIEDNQTVTINVTDGINTLNFSAIVTEGTWQINDADLSTLNDGTLTYLAQVNDIAGNTADTSISFVKDTRATISITVDTNSDISTDTIDNVINAVESTQVDISGIVSNIEDNQIVTLDVTDGATTLTFTTIVTDSTWQINNTDLSRLNDGTLTYSVNVSDIAGNPTETSITTDKDTQVALTVIIESGVDDFLLASEIMPVNISGTVTNVEIGQIVSIVLSNTSGDTDTITALVNADLTWSTSLDISSYNDGALTAIASVRDNAGNVVKADDLAVIDTSDGMAIFINTFQNTFDTIINAAEAVQVDISGLVRQVEDGQTITVTVSDGSTVLTFTTLVDGTTWSIPDANLTLLNDGTLTFTSTVTDLAGNETSATEVKQKDTQAAITLTVNTHSDTTDNVINAVESTQVDISGIVSNIEDNQTVALTVTDGATTLTFTTIVTANAWQVNDTDLSSLNDGTLTYTVNVNDIAGNPTEASTTTAKDTQAAITVIIESGADDFLLASELIPVNISGTVTNVEIGQIVSIVLSNTSGNTDTITTSVNADLTWSISLDISSYNDGALTAIASVSDSAGNEAKADNLVLIDTSDGIAIFINTFQDTFDSIINTAEAAQVDISGLVRQVEDGQTITVTVSDGNTVLTFNTLVDGITWAIPNANLTSLNDGALTFTSTVTDLAGNETSATEVKQKDTQAAITLTVNTHSDTADNVINAVESTQVDISGSVSNIEDNQTVALTVTDGVSSLDFSAIVTSGTWQINAADLSTLNDGTLTYLAKVNDIAGNPANTSISLVKDTRSAISIAVDTNSDTIINALESTQVDISGTVNNIEDNQTVTLNVTDGVSILTFTTIVTANAWQVSNTDLSSLNDGTLTYSVNVNDIAGNPAIASTTTAKDTKATITLAVETNADTTDNVINKVESTQVDISGTVNNIEDNQTITLSVTDGVSTLVFTTTVIAGLWQIPPADLSTLNDGIVTYTVNVNDIADNSAQASTSTVKDTKATITVVIDSGDDEFLLANETTPVNISGTVTNVEVNQTVTIILTNASGDTDTINATVNADLTWSTSLDISAYNEGELTASVSVNDKAGNTTTAADTAIIDTQIAIDIDTGMNGLDITAFRANNIDQFEGSTTAEIGQTVTLTITDGNTTKDFIGVVDITNHWVVSGIDITGLDSKTPWQVTSSVTDLAGNSATDDMPMIDIVRTSVFYETFVALIGSQTQSHILEVNNSAITTDSIISLSSVQTELDTITSQSESVTVTVASDGQSLKLIRDSDAELVMSIEIVLDATALKVTLYEAVNNPDTLTGILNTLVMVEAVQTDTDGSTETINLTSKIQIFDSPPLAIDDNNQVIENETSLGSLTGNDYTAEGPLKVTSVNIDGTDYVIPNSSSTTINLAYGDLTIGSDGAWSFIAGDSFDNTLEQVFSLTYFIVDNDGTEGSAVATFHIEDGKAGIMSDINVSSTEPDIDVPTNDMFNFSITAGSDALLANSISFDAQTLDKLTALDLMSNGNLLTYTTSNDGRVITGQVAGDDVFMLTLSAVNSGNNLTATLLYQQVASLDHTVNENFTLPLTVTALDLDNTSIESGKISLTINDGNTPQFSDISQITLDEAELSTGEQTTTGVISTLIGSDKIVNVIFSDITTQPSLTASGLTILYQISSDGKTLTGYTDNVNSPIFITQLSSNFNTSSNTIGEIYTFTLYQTLDQNISDEIPLSISVSDFDGDITTDNLLITIIDDASAQISTPDLTVSEIPVDFSSATSSDLGDIITIAGTDNLVDLDYEVVNGTPVFDSNGNELTQNDAKINWLNLGDGTLQGELANGTVIFTVSVPNTFIPPPENTEVTFTLLASIDHIGPQSDSLIIVIPMALIDQDGTHIVENMNVRVDDGLNPVIVTPGTANLVDEGLLVNNATVSTSGSYTIDSGSDQVVNVTVTDDYVFNGVSTRGGVNVSLASLVNSNGWYIATADDDNSEVFRVRFNTDNTYDYQQTQALDHAFADGENQLTLTFDIQAIDADGDKSLPQTLTVDIKDDIPEITTTTTELTEGDDLVLQLLSNKNTGADGAVVTKITYLGNNYLAGDTIILLDNQDDEKYAELIISADGSTTITSNKFNYPVDVYNDSLTYEVTDVDGDTVTSTLDITVRDATGTIITVNHSTDEDTAVKLNIIANPGDFDNGEVVTEIRINMVSLNGGTLTLDGMTIPDDGTDYILSGSLLTVSVIHIAFPNGELFFTPAENASDAIPSQQVILDVAVQIEESNGTKKPLINSTIEITINSVADLPQWDDSNSIYDYNVTFDNSIIEDGAPVALALKAALFDTDSSEVLTFRIENIDTNLVLNYTDGGSAITVIEGSILTETQLNTLTATSILNSSGLMTFSIVAIATEQDNNDFIEQPTKVISINVQAVADQPTITVKDVHSDEDVAINVNNIVSGQLYDVDGSETLSFELTLPAGWILSGLNGAVVSDQGNNVWSVLASDISASNIELIPLTDISSVNGTYTIDIQSVATDSATDGVPISGGVSKSEIKTLTVILTGVVDTPTIEASTSWSFDESNLTISNIVSFNEDTLIPLNFSIVTTDNDNSEVISLTITGFPDGVSLVDALGDDAGLNVVGFENGLPVYSVTSLDLQSLYLKPAVDFSGEVSLAINTITTERDGDSGEYLISLDINISPVVDENTASLHSSANGIEDQTVIINFNNILSSDIDGSEKITGAVITDFPLDATLTLDGSAYTYVGNLDLAVLATTLGVSLTNLLSSGRLGILPPEDATGSYLITLTYTIIDTSLQGDFIEETIATTIEVIVSAEVDVLTRFDVENSNLVSNDGSAIDLTGKIGFTDEDIDGSEILDYLVLLLPSGDNWLVTHPNGALPNGSGQWLIPIAGNLTSDSFQESNKDILDGVTILSSEATMGPVTVTLFGRVIDETDTEVIQADFEVQFDVSINSSASAVNNLQLTTIDGEEDQTVSFTGHLDNNIAGDGNDIISFRILATDLPDGVTLSGTGVKTLHLIDGITVSEYLFTQTSLANLSITSAGEDFAGVLTIPIRIIATDSASGDTLIDNTQTLTLDISPVVDGITLSNINPMQEDVPESIDLNLTFNDTDLLPSLGGSEQVNIDSDPNNNLTITLLNSGTLIDSTGYFVIKTGTTDTWQFTGTTKLQMTTALASISLQPIEHLAGDAIFTIQLSGNIIDTATMLAGQTSVNESFSEVVSITVEAVTDAANLTALYSEGNEDTAIDLSALSAQLIDQDGSETLYLTIQGVPAGAVLATDADGVGGNAPIPLPNNGVDGGFFDGKPTYSWTVTQAQLATLVLTPPLDFNGDIPLTLQAITKDQTPGEYVTTTATFIVGVNPISDGVDVFSPPESQYEQSENEVITIDLGAINTDINGDEVIQIVVRLNASSDASALINIDSTATIKVDTESASFISDGAGGFLATLTLSNNAISSFDLQLGNLAWGTFTMSVDVASIDTAVVNGNTISDTSPIESFNFDVELIPEVDAPKWISVGDVTVATADNIPLNLEITLQNPAPSESGYLIVSGLLTGLTLNRGIQQGDEWLVDLADVTSLEIIGANLGDNFDLELTPYAELNGTSENGAVQTINVDVNTLNSIPAPSAFMAVQANPVFENLILTDNDSFVNNLLDDMATQSQGMDT